MKFSRLPLFAASLLTLIAFPACGPAAQPSCPGPTCPAQGASTLAADPQVCGEIAASNGMVFWVDRGPLITDSIQAVSASGGTPTTIYTAAPDPNAAIEDLATDGVNLYFTEVDSSLATTIKSLPRAGGQTTVVLQDPGTLTIIAVDGSFLYYYGDQGNLERVAVTGGAPESLSPEGYAPFAFAANASGACWITAGAEYDGAEIVCEPASAAQPTVVAKEAIAPTAIAMSATQVVWANWQDSSIWTAPITGGPPTQVSPPTASNILVLAVDATRAYWLQEPQYFLQQSPEASSSTLWEANLDGSASSQLASSLYPAVGAISQAQGLVQNDSALFWTDVRGLVLTAPK